MARNDVQVAEWKKKVEEQKALTMNMRKNYLKEITHIRVMFSDPARKAMKRMKESREMVNARDYLKVHFFSPTEGLDDEICDLFNEHVEDLKTQYEQRMHLLSDLNFDLARKVTLYESRKQVDDMSSDELV
jgi:hypothetical protein